MGIRPIVSSCESPTENISQFIDYWLQPIMKGIPSYLKDTTELLNQLNELTIPKDVFLVTIDVIYQYTNNIRFKNRSLALKPKLRTNKRRLAFITRFTPSAAKAMKIIRRFWPSLRNSKTFKHINLPPPKLTFTSNRNIKSHLVRAKLAPTEDDTSIPPIGFSLVLTTQPEEVRPVQQQSTWCLP